MDNYIPEISIIVPIYNIEKYLDKCIQSILNQSFKCFELILVNDGSQDSSGKICDKYAIKDKRVKVIHKTNGGLSDARNVGIIVAKGKYIGFVDGDDYVDKDMYEKLYNSIKENNTKIAMCGRYNVSSGRCSEYFVLNNPKVLSSEEALRGLLTWTNLDSSSCDKLFSRELFDNIKFPIGKLNEDVYVMYKLIHMANGISHIGSPKYYYVERTGSITSLSFSKRKLDWPKAAKEILVFINENYPNLKEEAMYFYFSSLMVTIDLIVLSKESYKYYEIYEEYCNKLRNDIKAILSNKYIEKKKKLKVSLIITNKKYYMLLMNKYYSRKE